MIDENRPDEMETFDEIEQQAFAAGLEAREWETNFCAAMMSEACYVASEWTFHEEDTPEYQVASEDLMKGDHDLIAKALWIKNCTIPVGNMNSRLSDKIELSEEGVLPDGRTPFRFKNGLWKAGECAAAAVRIVEQDGRRTLHLSFRGTEPDTSVDKTIARSRLVFSYFLSTYTNIRNHYENFSPLCDSIVEFANNPDNRIDELVVSGHSLGGAVAREFMLRHPESEFRKNLKVSGKTFGSPGTGDGLIKQLAFEAVRLVSFPILKKFIKKKSADFDPRLTEIFHDEDPIPMLGRTLYDTNEDAKKERGFFTSIATVMRCTRGLINIIADGARWHSVKKYRVGEEQKLQTLSNLRKDFGLKGSKTFESWTDARKSAASMEENLLLKAQAFDETGAMRDFYRKLETGDYEGAFRIEKAINSCKKSPLTRKKQSFRKMRLAISS